MKHPKEATIMLHIHVIKSVLIDCHMLQHVCAHCSMSECVVAWTLDCTVVAQGILGTLVDSEQ